MSVCMYECTYVCMPVCVCVHMHDTLLHRPDLGALVRSGRSLVDAQVNAAERGHQQREGQVVKHEFDPARSIAVCVSGCSERAQTWARRRMGVSTSTAGVTENVWSSDGSQVDEGSKGCGSLDVEETTGAATTSAGAVSSVVLGGGAGQTEVSR